MDKTHNCALATQVGSFRIFIFQKEEEEVESLSPKDTKSQKPPILHFNKQTNKQNLDQTKNGQNA